MNILIKLGLLVVFSAILYLIIGLAIDEIRSYMQQLNIIPNFNYFMCKLGIFNAINIYLDFLLAGWVINKKINFVS